MSRLAQMQARFQQRQMQEKEEKLLRLYETQQQRAFEKVSRSSSGGSSISGGTSPVGLSATMGAVGGGRVRQMFDERRQKAGIDRSYPLEPLKQTARLNGQTTSNRANTDRVATKPKPSQLGSSMRATATTVQQKTVTSSQNGRPVQTRTYKQTTASKYANGRLVEEHSTFEERNGDGYAVINKNQKGLENMMRNHHITDDHEDITKMPAIGFDETDNSREQSPSPNENDYFIQKKNIANGNYAKRQTAGNSNGYANIAAKNVNNNNKSVTPIKKPKSTSKPATPIENEESTKRTPKMSINNSPVVSKTRQISSTRSSPMKPKQMSTVNSDNLIACKICQRRFAADRITKHEEVCAKTQKKKRKIYDAVKHRVEGTEIEQYSKKGHKGTTSVKISKPPQLPKTDWRRQHEDFIATIRAAKMAQAHIAAGGKLSDLPPPPPSYNPDYIQCPHCGRRFNEAAAERHIPKCATMLHNKPNRANSIKKK